MRAGKGYNCGMSFGLQVINQSAGGVVFRRREGKIEVVLISVGPEGRWQLPKGLIDPGETPEMAAVREIREEAGVETDLLMRLDTIEYWYYSGSGEARTRHHKFVQFFLNEYRSGDPSNHDDEVNDACWMEIHHAIEAITYKTEGKVLEKALQVIESQNPDQ